MPHRLHHYLASLTIGKTVLWFYLIWYLVNVINHFDPAPSLWLNALGISAVIGLALLLSVGGLASVDRWQTFRLFLMPFCVSSFSSLIKGHGFILIFPPHSSELAALVVACSGFVLAVVVAKRTAPVPRPAGRGSSST